MIEVAGNWRKGWAFDFHTLKSVPIGPNESGHMQFDTTRPEMGQLVYELKNKSRVSAVDRIVALLDTVPSFEIFDALVPVPATKKSRGYKPVDLIVTALGERRGTPVILDALKNDGSTQLKGVDDPTEREKLLRSALSVPEPMKVNGKKILLLDDLYRSGITLKVATELLYSAGAQDVCVLTMTKTRSNQ